MEWTDIQITVPQQYAETAEAIATMVSNGGIYIEDYRDLEQQAWEIAHVDLIEQDLLDQPRDIVKVHMYLAPDENPAEILPLFKERLEASGVEYKLETSGIEQEDWQNAWKKYYHAMDIGERLAIVPGWEDYRTDRIRIVMDPGMAFGTGTHETTSLCLETLDSMVKGGERVLDIGTGSGILAIAALKLGADSAEGVDIDPVAVRTAGENAALNGVADKLTVLVGDLSDKASGKYDIITANIVANAEQKTRESLERANARIEELTQDIIRVEKNRDAAWERFSEVSKQLDAAEASLKNKTLALTSLINDLEALGVEPKKHNTEEEQK